MTSESLCGKGWLKPPATIFEAVQKAGVRALVSAGWGGLGEATVPNNVFILKGKHIRN
jgi:hypothetical protein